MTHGPASTMPLGENDSNEECRHLYRARTLNQTRMPSEHQERLLTIDAPISERRTAA